MPEFSLLLGFVSAALVVLILPGPGVLYVIARSVSQGQRAGFASVLGLSVGAMVHVIAAAVGLSALLLASAPAFTVVKWLGAGYLIYLGVRTWLERDSEIDVGLPEPRSYRRLFGDGVVVSVLNPKIAMFFVAFLPQFVQPARGPVAVQILLLGGIYVALALVTDGVYAVLAGRLGHWLAGRHRPGRWVRAAGGSVYVGLGVTTALSDRP
ncbi:RhtB family transporter [Acidobacteria bacterium Mor1]|nr:RhtB family transporter [Acidobacteria bacterium Mor1]